jgi:hypothetical protein
VILVQLGAREYDLDLEDDDDLEDEKPYRSSVAYAR